MFFSWLFIFSLASCGLSGVESKYLGHSYKSNDEASTRLLRNADHKSYGGRSFDGYYMPHGSHGFDEMEDILPYSQPLPKGVSRKDLEIGFTNFLIGGIAALLASKKSGGNGWVRREESVLRANEEMKKNITDQINRAYSLYSELEEKATQEKQKRDYSAKRSYRQN